MERREKKKRKQQEPERYPRLEASIHLLKYLMWNTDREHRVKMANLAADPNIAPCIGVKDSFKLKVLSLANALNTDKDEVLLPEDEWQIVYDEYQKRYGTGGDAEEENPDEEGDMDDAEDGTRGKRKGLPIRNLYYQHIFSYEEIDCLLESLAFNQTADGGTAATIREKILTHLTSKYYKDPLKAVSRVRAPETADRELLHNNISTIQNAIDDVKLRFRFNGYDRDKRLVPSRGGRYTVSPYYIVANGGRFYLIASTDFEHQERHTMSIWRIDLMTEVQIPGRAPSRGKRGEHRVPKREVEGLPQEWSDDFHVAHMNMAFDAPVSVRLKITPPLGLPGYTFLHDWFGDRWRCVGPDTVEVQCSPWGMARWALQYGEHVEVLSPPELRREVAKLATTLHEKYGGNA